MKHLKKDSMKTFDGIFIISKKGEPIDLRKFEHQNIKFIEKFGFSDFKFDVRKMLKSDFVITYGDWHEDEDAKNAVLIARTCKMDVIHESQFKNYAEQKYN